MAQRRMVSKTISTSKKVNRISDKAALLYTWLIPHTDDYGHMDGDAKTVKAIVVPMRRYSLKEVERALIEMEKTDLVRRYSVSGGQFLEVVGFTEFQTFKKDRERTKLYPFPEDLESNGIQWNPNGTPKLSEDKLSEDNTAHSADEINPIIDLFKEVNPSYQT